MFAYLKKRKEVLLFLIIIFFALFFIQSYKNEDLSKTFFGKVVYFFSTSSQRFSSFLKKSIISFGSRQILLKSFEKENGILSKALEEEKLKNIENQKIRIAYSNLRKAFLFAEKNNDEMMLAEIIGDINDSYSKILIINRGSRDGILKNQSVVHASGVVGKIFQVNSTNSYVQLITDKKSFIPTFIQRTRDKGILYGKGNNRLVLRFVPLDSGIREGDVIVASGIAGIHNKDFPVGRVRSFQENVFFYSVEAVVEPFVNFSRLEFVFVVLRSNSNQIHPLFQEP